MEIAKTMGNEKQIRQLISQVLAEEVNNFLKKEKNTFTRELADNSKSKDLGDPLVVPLNVMEGPTGSDLTSPTVSVTTGKAKCGTDFTVVSARQNSQGKPNRCSF